MEILLGKLKIMLDRSFSALDYQPRLAVSDDVFKIIKKENKTVIIVTHDLAEAIFSYDYYYFIKKVLIVSTLIIVIKVVA